MVFGFSWVLGMMQTKDKVWFSQEYEIYVFFNNKTTESKSGITQVAFHKNVKKTMGVFLDMGFHK